MLRNALFLTGFLFCTVSLFSQNRVQIHNFEFNGDLTDAKGTGTTLTVHPNTKNPTFGTNEWSWTADSRPGGGLILQTDVLTNPQKYSVGFRVKYTEVTGRYKKILSFKGPSDDNGLYFHDQKLVFYPFGTSDAVTYQNDTFYDFVFSRDENDSIKVYVVEQNGTVNLVYSEFDKSDASVPYENGGKFEFGFFMDDETPHTEYATGGTVRGIRVWDFPLSREEIGDALSSVTTGDASNQTINGATISAVVNPEGPTAQISFEYGETTAYGNEITASPASLSGNTDQTATATLTGLKEATTYHYRVKSINSTGTAFGGDRTFKTLETFTLTYNVSGNGSITGDASQNVVEGNDGTEVTAVASADYEFSQWSDGVTTAARTDLDVMNNLSVTAEFIKALAIPRADLQLWVDAADVDGDGNSANDPFDNQTVTTWVDKSGNGNDMTQAGVTNASVDPPKFLSNQFNGEPALVFTKANKEALGVALASEYIGDYTVFIVLQGLSAAPNNFDSFFSSWNNSSESRSFQIDFRPDRFQVRSASGTFTRFADANKNLNLFTVTREGSMITAYSDGIQQDQTDTPNGSGFNGYRVNVNRKGNQFFDSKIAEVIVYHRTLDACELERVNGYLGEKYGRDYNNIDKNYDYASAFPSDLSGIGSFTTVCTNPITVDAAVSGILTLENPTSNDTPGEFLTVGHDAAGLATSTDAPFGFEKRISQVWRIDKDGDVGNVDLKFDLSALGGVPADATKEDYALLIDKDGTFSDAEEFSSILQINSLSDQIIAENISLSDGDYVSLAIERSPSAVATGTANRIIVNPSFENGSGVATWAFPDSQAGSNPGIDGWFSTHPPRTISGVLVDSPIEVWGPGQGPTAKDKSFYVELNAYVPSRLYQTVYLVNGEQFDWSYSHRKRDCCNNTAPDHIQFSLYTADGSRKLVTLDDFENSNSTSWTTRSGTGTLTLPTGAYQIGFESIANSNPEPSAGNWLDAVSIDLKAITEFTRDTVRLVEGQSFSPYIIVNGEVNQASTLTVQVDQEINAAEGTDYRIPNRTVNIPLGNYSIADSIPLPIEVIDNALPQNDRIIRFSVAATTGDATTGQDSNGDGYIGTFTVIIEDDDIDPANGILPGSIVANRIIVNPSFELGSVTPHIDYEFAQSQSSSRPTIEGWFSTHPTQTYNGRTIESPIEHWRSGFNGVPAQNQDYFVELNAFVSSRLYQSVFLVNGESFDWEYYHRQRTSGATETIVYAIYTEDGSSKLVDIDRHTASSTSSWDRRTGNFTWNGLTGIFQIGFEATTGTSSGNFLDNITIGLKGFTEFAQDTVRLKEGESIDPYFYVNGQVRSASTFTVQVDGGGLSTEGVDYRFSNKTVTVPTGNYSIADSLALNFEILDNDIPQNERIINLSISSVTGDIDQRDADADGFYQRTMVVIIEDDDPCKDPGLDETLVVCNTKDNAVNLLNALGGSPDVGGTWTESTSSGVTLGDGSSVDFTGVAAGSYTFIYTHAALGICPEESATLTVTTAPPFSSGNPPVNSTGIEQCDGSTIDLFSFITDETTGGVWKVISLNGKPLPDISDPANVTLSGYENGDRLGFVYEAKDGACFTAAGKNGTSFIIVIQAADNPGEDASITVCADKTVNLLGSLGGTPAITGTWTDVDGTGVTIGDGTNVDFGAVGAGSYDFTYTTSAPGSCTVDRTATLTINIDQASNAGTDGTLIACNHGDDTTFNLFAALGSSPEPGGTWTDDDGLGVNVSDGENVDFLNKPAGTYDFTYTLPGNGVCTDATAKVTVTLSNPAFAGLSGSATICTGGATSSIVDFMAIINRERDADAGTWSIVDAPGIDISDPTEVDFSRTTDGRKIFRYSVTNNCGTVTSDVVVNVNAAPRAGFGTTERVCVGDDVELFKLLSGSFDFGGTWSERTSSGASLDPGLGDLDLTGVTAGTYAFDYTVPGSGICAEASSTVTLIVAETPRSGTSAGAIELCASTASQIISLFDGLAPGTFDSGGTWTALVGNGIDISNPTSVDFSNLSSGSYIFNYEVTGSCETVDTDVIVTILESPAGEDGTVDVCNLPGAGAIVDLFSTLTGSPKAGGTWLEVTSSGVDISDPTKANFSNVAAGSYQFVHVFNDGTSCNGKAANAKVTVNVTESPNAGISNAVNVCDGGASTTINFFTSLGGSPVTTGSWVETTASGVNITNPNAVDFNAIPAGSYEFEYTVNGTGPCTNVTTKLTVNVNQDHDAGGDGVAAVCNDGSTAVDLFANLTGTPDPGGVWSQTSGGTISLSDVTAVDFTGATAGAYEFTYTIAGEGVCNDVSSQVTVTVSRAAVAGNDNTVNVCDGGASTILNLQTSLGGTPDVGGVWAETTSSGVSLVDPTAVDFNAVTAGAYTFTYTVTGPGVCIDDVATLTVNVNQDHNAGIASVATICNEAGSVLDLFANLQGSPDAGGTWSTTSSISVTDPTSIDFSGVTAGAYAFTYSITGEGVCNDVSATLTVTVVQEIDAGVDASMTICNDGSSLVDLFANLGGTPDTGGIWADLDGSSVDLSNLTSIDFSGIAGGTYGFEYVVTDPAQCSTKSSTLSITVEEQPNAGDNHIYSICNDGSTINLMDDDGTTRPSGGTWYDLDGAAVNLTDPTNVSFSGVTSASGGPVDYTFLYVLPATTACKSDTARVIMSVYRDPSAGNDNTVNVCDGGASTTLDLFNSLGGSPDLGGTWKEVVLDNADPLSGAVLTNPSSVDFNAIPAGKYFFEYTVPGNALCGEKTATLTVNVNQDHDAGSDAIVLTCNDPATTLDLFASLGGTPEAGGTWSDDSSTGVSIGDGKTVSFSGLAAGDYEFTYSIAGEGVCNTVSATLTVTVIGAPNAGLDNTISVCDGGPSTVVNLFGSLGGIPEAGGTWVDVNGSGVTIGDASAVDFDAVPAGKYNFTYTVAGTAPCADATSTLVVNVNQDHTTGTGGSILACADDVNVSLFAGLTGTVDPGGIWSDDDNTLVDLTDPNSVEVSSLAPGDYQFTYTITGEGVCNDVSSTVTLTINASISAGFDNVIDVCNGTSTSIVDLFGSLAGTPTTGGAWFDNQNSGVDLSDPTAVDFSGIAPGGYSFYYFVSQPGFCGSSTALLTVNVQQAPSAGAPLNVFVCNDEFGILNFNELRGEGSDASGTWSDDDASGIDLSNLNLVRFEGITAGDYDFTYTVPASGPCGEVSNTITVTVFQSVDAGFDSFAEVCNDGTTLDFFNELKGTPDLTGIWNNKDGASVDLSNPNSVSFAGVAAGVYRFGYSMIVDNGPCVSKSSVLEVTVHNITDAGKDVVVPICIDPSGTVIDLAAGLSSNAQAGGAWVSLDDNTIDLTNPTAVDLSAVTAGTYNFQYTVTGEGSCADDIAIITLEASVLANAGTNGTVDVCNDGSTVDLFAALGSNADTGGTWFDLRDSGADIVDPTAADFSFVRAGSYVFQYVVPGVRVCPDVAATVTVNVSRIGNAGLPSIESICDGGPSTVLDLFSSLDGSPDTGGTWSESTSSGANISDPSNVDFDGIAAGRYVFTYTVAGQGPCSDVSNDLVVSVNQDHNPGTDTSVDLCNDVSAFNLNTALAGSPDPGGRWLDISGSGVILDDPSTVDFRLLGAGTYQYRYVITGEGVCNDVSSVLTVNLSQLVFAGNDATADVCNGGATTLDVFASLGGFPDAGGSWNDDDNSGVSLTDPSNVDFAGLAAGAYNFTYTVTGPGACSDDTAVLTVNVTRIPVAGIDATVQICNDGSTVDLFGSLGGTPDSGGTWQDVNGANVDLSDVAAVDFSSVNAGTYNFVYTVSGSGPCLDQTATITVEVTRTPDAGNSNTISVCDGGASTFRNLFASLKGKPDFGGSWTDDNSAGVDLSDPKKVNFNGITAGRYQFTYTVAGQNTCNDASSILIVNVNQDHDPGTDATVEACNNDGAFDLFGSIGGTPDPGGLWRDLDNSGIDLTQLPKKVSLKGVTAGTYRFEYEIKGEGVCNTVSSTLTLNIGDGVFAGNPTTIEVCNDSGMLDLQSALGITATSGGTWTESTSSGVDLTDPTQVDFTSVAAGVYTYTYSVTGTGVCPDDSAVITVNVTETPHAGPDAIIELCNTAGYDLTNALGAMADINGTWSFIAGANIDDSALPLLDLTSVAAGAYTFRYTVSGTGPCIDDFADITLNITEEPNAGFSSSVSVCDGGSSTVVNLFTSLGGSPEAGGMWSEITSSGADITDPFAVDFDAIPAGEYQFLYTVTGTGPCPNANAIVFVHVDQDANPGTDTSVDVCTSDANLNLFALLNGQPNPGGTWTDIDGSGLNISDITNVDISNATPGTFRFNYTISGTGVCNDVNSTLTLDITEAVDAGNDNTLEICNDGSTLDLFGALGANTDTGGSWIDLNGSGVNLSDASSVSFSGIVEGSYQFRYTVTGSGPCSDDSALITVDVIRNASAGAGTTLTVCNDNVTYDLFAALGSPDAGGVWTDDDNSGIDLLDPTSVSFNGLAPGNYDYTYSVSNNGKCVSSATLTVTVTQQVNAGDDSIISVCDGGVGTTRDLFASLSGSPDAGGTWSETTSSGVDLTDPTNVDFNTVPAGRYSFTYTVSGPNACNDDTATLIVNVNQVLDAGSNSALEICNDNVSVNLFGAITGTPDAGGNWNDDDATGLDLSNPSSVDFSSLTAGDYDFTYTIPGDGTCATVASTLTITVNQAANAGADAQLTTCNLTGSSNLDLFAALGNSLTAGGSWIDVNNAGIDLTDPTSVDFDGTVEGDYDFRYIVSGAGNCSIESATVTVTVTRTPDAGVGGNTSTVNDGREVNLTALLTGADSGGSWTDLDGAGVDLNDPDAVSFGATAAGSYTFQYEVSGNGPCASSTTTVEVTVSDAANAGISARVQLCTSDASSLDLIRLLDGSPSTSGQWISQGNVVDVSNPASVDLSSMRETTYIFNYVVSNPGSQDKSTLTIDLSKQSNAGVGNVQGNEIVTCNSGSDPLNLFSMLAGAPDMTGAWRDLSQSGVDLTNPTAVSFDGIASGFYEFQYEVAANGSCFTSYASLFIEVDEGANAGNDVTIEVCNGSNQEIDLFAVLLGTPDTGGTWTDQNGAPANSQINFNGIAAGSYDFTYTIQPTGPCNIPVSSVVTVEVFRQPVAGLDNSIDVTFNDNSTISLFDSLAGTPDPGGVWIDDNSTGIDLSDPTNVDLSVLEDGIYNFRYLVDGGQACTTVEAVLTIRLNLVAQSNTDTKIIGGFSPDGDGLNETWEIENIEQFPSNKVQLFNRWGHKVFEMSGYNNTSKTFDGTSNNGTVIGKNQLPAGTYFYIIDFGDGRAPIKGFITLVR